MFCKRKITTIVALVIIQLISVILFSSCADNRENTNGTFSVKFIGGENGVTSLINLPDDKVVLLGGGSLDIVKDKIVNSLETLSADNIDYLFINSPLNSGVKNAIKINDLYNISTIYKLNILNESHFENYNHLISLDNKNIKTCVFGEVVKGDGYFLAVLSPCTNLGEQVFTSEEIAYVSPIIYLDYFGVRFLFICGETSNSFSSFLESYHSGAFNCFLSEHGKEIDLSRIDFLHILNKVAKDNKNKELFLQLQPKNAVITTSIDSSKQNISSLALKNLYDYSSEIAVYQCAEKDLTVSVNENSSYSLSLE